MNKKEEPKERKNLTSGEFTKLFIKHFLLNGIVVGIILYIVSEIAKAIFSETVITILNFVLIFVVIIKVYFSAIKDSFNEGKIYKEDINKIARNIVLTFIVISIMLILLDYINYARKIELAKMLGMEEILQRNLIMNIVINVVMYTILAISCKVKFLKECKKEENVV